MTSTLFSTEPEVAVLSIIMNNPEVRNSLSSIRPDMFSSLSHRVIYETILNLSQENLNPDYNTVCMRLEGTGRMANAGSKEYIRYLCDQHFDERNINEFERLVIDSYKARTLLSLATSVKTDTLTLDNVNSEITKMKAGLDSLTESSQNLGVAHISDLTKSFYDDFIKRIENPGMRGVSWGIDKIDKISGGKSPGEFWIIAGRPGSGKTAVLCNSALADGMNKVPSLIISREMSYKELFERFIPIYTGMPISNLRLGIGINNEQLEIVRGALKKLNEMPIYIDTNYMGMSEYYIESVVRKHHSMHGIKTLYVDYVQLLVDRDDNQTAALGRISRTIKVLSESLQISTILLSQLNREVEHRDNKRPVLSDLRQSGNLEEDADWVVGLYRDYYYDKTTKDKDALEFIILKARNGPVGVIPLKFQADNNRITGDS